MEYSTVRVVVAEGSVALGASATEAGHHALLTPGQLGTLARGADMPDVRRVNVESYLAWTQGRLVFDETPLPEVASRLDRRFGTTVTITDHSLRARTLTASFTTESLDDVLAALGPALDVRFERSGDSVIVRAR